MEWIDVNDRPKSDLDAWVIHLDFYPFEPILASYSLYRNIWSYGPRDVKLPSCIPLTITHYIPIPPRPKK